MGSPSIIFFSISTDAPDEPAKPDTFHGFTDVGSLREASGGRFTAKLPAAAPPAPLIARRRAPETSQSRRERPPAGRFGGRDGGGDGAVRRGAEVRVEVSSLDISSDYRETGHLL